MKTHLVIVDMQPNFKAANDEETVAAVIREIHLAKKRGGFIFLVEYDGFGKSHPLILKALPFFKRKWMQVEKRMNDGSQEIFEAAKKRSILLERVRVVGVNTDACVEATVKGLAGRSLMQINVIEDACNTDAYTRTPEEIFHRTFVKHNLFDNVSVG